jgi:hypothetical protein
MSAILHDEEQAIAATRAGDKISTEDTLSSASPVQDEAATSDLKEGATTVAGQPLPEEEAPPLPDEPPPDEEEDGWEPKWEPTAQAWYFVNNRTGVSQWENPRVPVATTHAHSHGPYDRFANFYHFFCPFPA